MSLDGIVRYAGVLVVAAFVLLPSVRAMAAPPDCSEAYASPNVLWPPNHKFSAITIAGMGDASVIVQCISQDEPLNTNGDGNTEYDSQGVGSANAKVRAERIGGGNGRVYHIDFVASNADGQCAAVVQVGIPPSKKKPVTDDGPLYTSVADVTLCAAQALNLPPVIESLPVELASVNENYQYDVQASDSNGDPISYTLTTAPDDMSIHATTGMIQWQPTAVLVGEHTVEIIVADDKGGSTVQAFTLVVSAQTNHDPVVLSAPVLQAPIGQLYTYTVMAEDLDGDPLNISLLVFPAGMTMAASGVITWLPVAGQEGDHVVSVFVDDGQGGTVSQDYIVAVPISNAEPLISSESVPQAVLGEPYHYSVIATDPDGDVLIYRLMQAPAGMAIDIMTGMISWVSVLGQEGDHVVEVLVEDGLGASANQLYTLSVIVPNNNPVISSSGVESAAVGLVYIYSVIAQDPDNDTLTYTLASAPSTMVIDSDTGEIRWIPQAQHLGSHNIVVLVTDGRDGSASQSYTVSVIQPNRRPQISSEAVVDANEGQSYQYPVIAVDPDGDPIVYSLLDSPQEMTIDSQSGMIDWMPNYQSGGEYEVTVQVQDIEGVSSLQTFTLTVANINRAPSIVSAPVISGVENQIYHYALMAIDPDGAVIAYTLSTAPTGMSIDAQSGLISWLPDYDAAGTYTITVDINDGQGAIINHGFTLTIENTNRLPVANAITASGDSEQAIAITLSASDGDGDALTYTLSSQPSHGSLSGQAPNLSYTSHAGFFGIDSFSYIGHDATDDSLPATVTVTVNEPNFAPIITSAALTDVAEGFVYHYPLIATDPNSADVLSYSLTLAPPGMSINAATGEITWVADAQYVQSVDQANSQCQLPPPDIGIFDPVVKWHWQVSGLYVLATPVVAPLFDTNDDGLINTDDDPVVIILAYGGSTTNPSAAAGQLLALDGKTGEVLWSHANLVYEGAYFRGEAFSVPAVGDIDKDGIPEIVMLKRNGGVAVTNNDGTVKWVSALPTAIDRGAGGITLADIDGDGDTEILARNYVLNHDGTEQWHTELTPNSHMAPLALDLDLDGDLEVIMAEHVFDTGGQLLWQGTGNGNGGFANLDQDAYPEIVMTGNGELFVYEHDGTIKWSFDFPGVITGGGAPFIDDVDGDGMVEIGLATKQIYYVFNHDGSILWTAPMEDFTTRGTGSIVFDLDGDGDMEVIFGDEKKLYVLDGKTGTMIFERDKPSWTVKESNVIADIDGDGHAEILVVNDGGDVRGIQAIESEIDSWAPTRKIWNQYAYHVDNINDDLSIPANPTKSWQIHNSFRKNRVPDPSERGRVDLRVGDISFDQSTSKLSVAISNLGLIDMNSPATVTFYNGDPAQGGTIIGSGQMTTLASNTATVVELQIDPLVDPLTILTNDIVVTVNEQQAIEECDYQNNHSRAALVSVNAQDPQGMHDTQTYLINVHDVNSQPQITSTPPTNLVVSRNLFEYQLSAVDTDRGDALHYRVINAPDGVSINPITGLLRWQPVAEQAGAVQFTVVVSDLAGQTSQQVINLTVEVHPPVVVTSTPPDYIFHYDYFSYQVDVQYPEAPGLRFRLAYTGFFGMSIDTFSGLLTFPAPPAYPVGANRQVTIIISDDYGNGTLYGTETTHSFFLTVKAANEAPVIASAAYPYVKTEQPYYYLMQASEPEGEAISYSLGEGSPANMLIDSQGVLSWDASAADVGWHSVDILLDDSSGHQASQSVDLLVTEPGLWGRRLCPPGIDMNVPPVGGE